MKRSKILLLLFLGLTLSTVYSQEPEMFKLLGFATEGSGTSGGAGGDTITVSTGTELQNALLAKKDNVTPLVILVEGLINEANSGDLSKIDVKEVNDVTILGSVSGAEFEGIGLKVRRSSNIILRNLKVHHVVNGEGDCIGIEGPSDHIWVDHCELYNEYQDVDKDYYDGLLDAKADCEYITYSWNFLHDSWKTALVGSSESDTYDRKLTMHHNYFLNCNSRIPLFRGSTGHFFNNYYKDIASTAINSRINACVLIENNYFENTKNPWVSAYSDVLGGGESVGNILVNSPFQYTSDTHELPFCSPSIPYEYSDLLNDAEHVPSLVMNFAGVGKLGLMEDPVFTVSKTINGSGSISIEPDKPYYDSGELVSITATPDTFWEFDGWSGDVGGNENPKQFAVDSNMLVMAIFKYEATDVLDIQFEEVYCALTGSIETEHEGFTGSGFVDFENAAGSTISLAIDATESVVCTMELRYAHGKTDDRSMEVVVNGVSQVAELDFPTTGAFTTWDTVRFDLTLAAGNNLIEWFSLTSNGGPNFDKVDIIANVAVLSRANCEEEPKLINAPGSLSVVTVSDSELDISWADNSDNESGFIIERKQEGGSFTEIADLDAGIQSFRDDQLSANSTFYYRVKAYGLSGESSWSNIASASTDPSGFTTKVSVGGALSVYPNPISGEGFARLTLEETGEVSLSLINLTGSKTLVYKGFVQEGSIQTIPLIFDQYSPGIYLLEMVGGAVRIIRRIVILN